MFGIERVDNLRDDSLDIDILGTRCLSDAVDIIDDAGDIVRIRLRPAAFRIRIGRRDIRFMRDIIGSDHFDRLAVGQFIADERNDVADFQAQG